MPMSARLKKRLEEILPEIIAKFGTPFIIMDYEGIKQSYQMIDKCLEQIDHRLYFAVKACPIPDVLLAEYCWGAGFDCSSLPEIEMVYDSLSGHVLENDIMFTSNNTSREEFEEAIAARSIINFDDISLLDKVPKEIFPEKVCFRYNPGPRRSGNAIIGEPVESKYGVPHEQIAEAYKQAIKRGAKKFGLHTMICSNAQDGNYLVKTVEMLTDVARILMVEVGISLDFINMGGGLGIPYYPHDPEVNIAEMFTRILAIMKELGEDIGEIPRLLMEFGRYMTGPHGVLVMSCINRMKKYRTIIGVDASMPANPRPAIYGAYHHITVLGKESATQKEVVDVVGSLCEGCDKFAEQRELPIIQEGDILLQHDVGAHAIAMGSDYNFRFIPSVLMLKDDEVVCIRPAKKYEHHLYLYKNSLYGQRLKIN